MALGLSKLPITSSVQLSSLRSQYASLERSSASCSSSTQGVIGDNLVCRVSQHSSRRSTIVMQATENKTEASKDEVSDNRILQYCSIDKREDKRSLGDLEQEFLAALQSFYYDKQPIMSNEEFDNLKEELIWGGSSVAVLSSDEHRFMEASLAYAAGKPVMSDQEYDELKMRLKKANSKVAIRGPRCSIRSKKVCSDSTIDYLKMTLLNLPAAVIALGVVFFLDDLTGFQITYFLELPQPYGFIFTWSVVLPGVFYLVQFITNQIVKDFIILKGPCPNCGASNTSFFGTILTVPSGGKVNTVKCEQCKAVLNYDAESRLITIESLGGQGPKTPSPAA